MLLRAVLFIQEDVNYSNYNKNVEALVETWRKTENETAAYITGSTVQVILLVTLGCYVFSSAFTKTLVRLMWDRGREEGVDESHHTERKTIFILVTRTKFGQSLRQQIKEIIINGEREVIL